MTVMLGGAPQSAADDPASTAGPLLSFEDLIIYSTHIVVAGKRRELTDIATVDGGAFNLRMNMMPAVKHTHLKVGFRDGHSFKKDEQRSLFGGDRHKAIATAVTLLRNLTFRPFFDQLCWDVRASPAQIGVENDAPIHSAVSLVMKAMAARKPAPIYLHRAGTITNGILTLDLKECRREGILELGIYRTNLSEPESIYASNTKSMIEKSHRHALRFGVQGKHRPDVVMALLNWMATPGNEL